MFECLKQLQSFIAVCPSCCQELNEQAPAVTVEAPHTNPSSGSTDVAPATSEPPTQPDTSHPAPTGSDKDQTHTHPQSPEEEVEKAQTDCQLTVETV